MIITLDEKTILVNMVWVDGPLDFNMLLGHDCIYVINVVVSTLFRLMNCHQSHYLNLIVVQDTTLYVPSIQVDSTLPQVNYVASYSYSSISFENNNL